MNYADYISGISFRFIKPHTFIPKRYRLLESLLNKAGISLETINTKIPRDEKDTKRRLHEICKIPKMSTLAISVMINQGVSQMPDTQAFVNVGVWHGFTFLSGIVGNAQKKCIGIDNFSDFGGPREAFLKRFNRYKSNNHYFYDMDYKVYFSHVHKDPIGFYIYDGSHKYDDQLRGLTLAEPFFSQNCIILIDDVNLDEPRRGTVDFISNSSYEYRVLLDQTTYCNCHPTLWNGIMIFQKIK